MTIKRLTRLSGRFAAEPIDPDIEDSARLRLHPDVSTVLVVMIGGVIGALGRYAATLWWPTPPSGFPWTTFGINALGSLLLAAVVVLSTERWTEATLLRPLLGTGVIGGFTTFSTFTVDQQRLLTNGHPGTAITYLAATLAVCASATLIGQRLTGAALDRGRR